MRCLVTFKSLFETVLIKPVCQGNLVRQRTRLLSQSAFTASLHDRELPERVSFVGASGRRHFVPDRAFSTTMSFWLSGRNTRPWEDDPALKFKEDVEEYTTESDIKTDVLLVQGIEDNRETDAVAHHTNDFDQTKYYVVRRGQDFSLKVILKRPFDPEKDDLKLTFQFGVAPDPFVGTHISLKPDVEDDGWIAKLNSNTENTLEFSVTTNPRTCAVGPWKISVDTKPKYTTKFYRFAHKEPIRILFNPWCKDDTVYMGYENGPLETELEEYVLNETGAIYVGSARSNSGRAWRFGQFDDIVLETAEYLLQKEGFWRAQKLSPRLRGNPIFVSRKFSAMINGNDDGGVIFGNWSGEYEDGTNPGAWTGSVKILEEYMKSRKADPTKDAETVKYGQCWVFSGLTTTLCRAVGIPCRSVTNFNSAHDKDETSDINLILSEDYDLVGGDSVWNFHVWNDVWLKRPDLSSTNKYDGWQAIDATPQEASEGPAPLLAIKNGSVTKNYDSRFVFAEVNGDLHYWMRKKDGEVEFILSKPQHVGKQISTKKVGEFGRNEVTDLYKYPEGSKENEKAVEKAKSLSERNRVWDRYMKIERPIEDVTVTITLNQDTVIGADLDIQMELNNMSIEPRTIKNSILHVVSKFYTNNTHKKVKDVQLGDITLKPNEKLQKGYKVLFDDYYPKLTDFNILAANFSGIVEQTEHHITEFENTTLQKPKLNIKAPKQVKLNQNFQVMISFKNPLSIPLTNCRLTVEGTAFFSFKLNQSNLGPKRDYTLSFEQMCRKVGKKSMIISFDSDELLAIRNVLDIKVEE